MAENETIEDAETTGHEWNGIKELNTPMPRWWLWTFYATIVWAFGYMIAYPAWPLINGATPGVLGYSTRGEVAADIAAHEAAHAEIEARLMAVDLPAVLQDQELLDYANSGGAAIFRTYCAQCHGAGAAGVQAAGYPNLLDDDWLWGGKLEDIQQTVTHGIRWEDDPDTRFSQMPAFGEILSNEEIEQVAAYVRSLSGLETGDTGEGATIFAENCAACHGEEGTGDREQGAPNLTDAVWLYGNSPARVAETIKNSRFGMMPQWQTRLSPEDIRKVTVYVHQRGGGE
jgi:cytochrome c oxidase cbb3-type subunit III